MKLKNYLWYIPALYVAYMFGNKIVEGLGHSEEFASIISVIPLLKPYAYSLTPLVGIFDFFVGVSLLLQPVIFKSNSLQRFIFVWVVIWPFIPASLRYFSGMGDFEIVEVLSISVAALISFGLWERFSKSSNI